MVDAEGMKSFIVAVFCKGIEFIDGDDTKFSVRETCLPWDRAFLQQNIRS
jgi:hypothetical protein